MRNTLKSEKSITSPVESLAYFQSHVSTAKFKAGFSLYNALSHADYIEQNKAV
jgi:hypothetical protein